MKKKSNKFLVLYAAALAAYLGLMAYVFRYELGLKGPNFKPGDCISWTYESEFETNVYPSVVLKVGKKEYLLLNYLTRWNEYSDKAQSESIKRTDELYEKSDLCPDVTFVEQ